MFVRLLGFLVHREGQHFLILPFWCFHNSIGYVLANLYMLLLLCYFICIACTPIALDHLLFLWCFLGIINYPSIYLSVKITSDSPLFQAVLKTKHSHNL